MPVAKSEGISYGSCQGTDSSGKRQGTAGLHKRVRSGNLAFGGLRWKASRYGQLPRAGLFVGLDVARIPLERVCVWPDGMVFGPEPTYMGADGNHAVASGSGCSCRPAEGMTAQNRAGTGCHLPSDQSWAWYGARCR